MPVDLPFTAGGEWMRSNQCAGMGIMGESGKGLESDATAIISKFLEARGQSWVVVPFTLFDDGTVRSIGCRCFRFWRAARLFRLGQCGGGIMGGGGPAVISIELVVYRSVNEVHHNFLPYPKVKLGKS